jgi:hypothetical protein
MFFEISKSIVIPKNNVELNYKSKMKGKNIFIRSNYIFMNK